MQPSAEPYALVVDDDPFVLMTACDILQDAGFRAFEATSADEAVELIGDHGDRISLLFTDIQMPGERNGLALARYVADRWPHIDIVVTSGRVRPTPPDIPEKAAFISKPFNPEIVHRHIRRGPAGEAG